MFTNKIIIFFAQGNSAEHPGSDEEIKAAYKKKARLCHPGNS